MYSYKGMVKIEYGEALNRFFNNEEIYLLYDDNSEAVAVTFADMTRHNMNGGEFGYERIIK